MNDDLQRRPGGPRAQDEEMDQVLRTVRIAIAEVKYGSVEIVIHDSKVVQIERREKIRFDNDHSVQRR